MSENLTVTLALRDVKRGDPDRDGWTCALVVHDGVGGERVLFDNDIEGYPTREEAAWDTLLRLSDTLRGIDAVHGKVPFPLQTALLEGHVAELRALCLRGETARLK